MTSSAAFALRLAWRQTRGGSSHFGALVASVALGVGALVAVSTFAATLEGTLAREARALMGGDIELRAARPLGPEADAALEGLRRAGAATTLLRELVGMARDPARGGTLLVELKVADPAYPLYGRVETAPARPLAELLAHRDGVAGAVVQADLLARLGVAVGDHLAIGAATFAVRGVLRAEPDRPASIVSLGPRVLIGAHALERTGLVTTGSRVRYRALVRLPERVELRAAHEALARGVSSPSVRIASFDEAQPGLRRFFAQLTTYLGLVGLASLLVGGIGVAASATLYLRRQLATIAILKCLGATSRRLLAAYLLQLGLFGAAGSALGALLGVLVQPLLIPLLAGLVPFALEARLDPWSVVRGIATGTLTTLLCALWPLLEIRRVPPSLILRRDVDPTPRPGRRPWAAALPLFAGLGALAVWQAGSLALGAIFVAASLAALTLLVALARGLARLARAVPPPRALAWRQGIAGLGRPGGHATRVIVALGVGVMLLAAVALLEGSLGDHIDHERRREAPSFFFVDVQPDQREAFSRLVGAADGGVPPALTPVVRGRLAAIDAAPLTRQALEARRARGQERLWYFTREYVLTFADAPPPANRLTRGRWWTAAEAAERPRVSVEEEAARHLGLDVGSRVTFDVQGVAVDAEVMSLRRVDWHALTTNFFVIFSPGALDGAPATYVATARVPAGAEAALQDRVVAAFPNVTAIPLRDVLERVAGVLEKLALAVRVIALFTVAAGLSVMTGTLAATRYQRLYESAILRTLGATRGAVARAFAVEYACLGAAAGIGGTALAVVLAWIVLRFLLHVPWTLEPDTLALSVALTIGLALAVGFLATFRLLGQKPLYVLRRE